MRRTALTMGVAVLLAASGLEGQQTTQGLEGAWRVTEVVTTGPLGRTLGAPQPGLLLFTGGYYSYTLVTSDVPRALPSRGIATVEDMLDVWSPFTANAGTFEVSGNSMTRRPVVAKSPDAMAPGAFNEYTFRLSADTLWARRWGPRAGWQGAHLRSGTSVSAERRAGVVRILIPVVALGALSVSACSSDGPSAGTEAMGGGYVDDARIINAPSSEPGSWLTYGQTYKEQRFSHLTQITRDNVDELGLAWTTEIGDNNMRMQGTPLVVDGVMYVTNGWSVVYALDATNGEEIWRYDPEVDRSFARLACCGPAHNRGVAVYQGKVYVGTFDGRLVAVDVTTGEEVWDVDTWIPEGLGRFNITGAPRGAAGKVYIGQGSSESGHRRGYVTAYDAETGEVAWRFFLVPGDPSQPFEHPEMEMAAQTWGGEWWKYGGGGTAWNSLVYDEEFNSLYIGVGNGAPWPRDIRSPGGGDDLFLSTVVSVDVESGRMNWYYQTTPGDNWDYSSAMDITLGEIELNGEMRKVLLQAPKNGFFYVLDREDGELLRAHPYTDGITWATHVDMETGRPVENPDVVYESDPQWILPANSGAHNWEPQSWDNDQGLMYFYYHDVPNFYSLDETFVNTGVYEIRERGLSLGWGEGEYRNRLIAQADPRPESKGFIAAFDPITGQYKWRHQLESVYNGGVLATTTGLLFQGEGTRSLVVRDTETGEPIWRYDGQGTFGATSVMTYQIGNTQYVAVLMNGNRSIDLGGSVVVLKLGGEAAPPTPTIAPADVPEQPDDEYSDPLVTQGNELYHAQCASCHGGIGIPNEVAIIAPDLRLMTLDTHADLENIVIRGARAERGMPGFEDALSSQQLEAIRAFIVTQARQLRE